MSGSDAKQKSYIAKHSSTHSVEESRHTPLQSRPPPPQTTEITDSNVGAAVLTYSDSNNHVFTQEEAEFFYSKMLHYAVESDINKVRYDAAIKRVDYLENSNNKLLRKLKESQKLNDIYLHKVFIDKNNKNNKNNNNNMLLLRKSVKGCKPITDLKTFKDKHDDNDDKYKSARNIHVRRVIVIKGN